MKKYKKIISIAILVMLSTLFSGCSTRGLLSVVKDPTLPQIYSVKHIVGKRSVGFEWSAITDSRVKGIKVYRSTSQSMGDQKYKRIATIDDRYATHFVDVNIMPNQTYFYKFTTYSLLKESFPGAPITVRTMEPFEPVSFVETYMLDKGVVKVLWTPHPSLEIFGYILERKISGGKWKYLASIRGRLMPEYIDKSAAIGYTYSYRVIARSSGGTKALPSSESTIVVQ